MDVEDSWDIEALVAAGTVTWPAYTYKTYPNFQNPNWEPDEYQYFDDSYRNSRSDFHTGLPLTPNDYFSETLDYDEHPLEIQCSSCMLERIKYGISSQFGEIYDEMTMQVRANIQKDCGITDELVSVVNMTGVGSGTNFTYVAVDYENYSQAIETPSYTAASLPALNNAYNCATTSGTFCAPSSCNITVNMTVCVGPPGGAYVPSTATVVVPSVYTIIATPVAPTVSGTIANCGLYYNVTAGDYWNLVALKYSLTFSEFVAMNPSIDSCSNLELGVNYCVAVVNETTVPVLATTLSPSGSTSSYKQSSSSTSTSTSTSTAVNRIPVSKHHPTKSTIFHDN
ncbi:hypothetical protein BDZ45DRAFT_747162 [Acephala macrosclerotiorum]|nr:hypothetical protein BDZ45DRAFT_747162 [Acephala macrosclerotiorum]